LLSLAAQDTQHTNLPKSKSISGKTSSQRIPITSKRRDFSRNFLPQKENNMKKITIVTDDPSVVEKVFNLIIGNPEIQGDVESMVEDTDRWLVNPTLASNRMFKVSWETLRKNNRG
jgi:hypothetical protein